jgi:hypothetical protein
MRSPIILGSNAVIGVTNTMRGYLLPLLLNLR